MNETTMIIGVGSEVMVPGKRNGHETRKATVVGESRDKTCWRVHYEGTSKKSTDTWHKSRVSPVYPEDKL